MIAPFSFLNTSRIMHQPKFVTVGPNVTLWSTDGIDWTLGSMPSGDWRRVQYGGGVYMAVGPDICAISTDGKTFTSVAIPTGYWSDLAFMTNLNRWVITAGVTGATPGQNTYLTSDDNGVSFISRPWPITSTQRYPSIAYGDGQVIALRFIASGNNIMRSTDGINWTQQGQNSAYGWKRIAFIPDSGFDESSQGYFVATSEQGGSNRLFYRRSDSTGAWATDAVSGTTPLGHCAGFGGAVNITAPDVSWPDANFATAFFSPTQIVGRTPPLGGTWWDIAAKPSNTGDVFIAVCEDGNNTIARTVGYNGGWTSILNPLALKSVCYG